MINWGSLELKEKIINTLCKDYQTIWLIDIEDQSLLIFSDNTEIRVPKSVEICSDLKNYDEARKWYIQNCANENDKSRLLDQTSFENICRQTENNKTYFIEYNRIYNGKINYNQLTYARIQISSENKTYMLLGFRDIDVNKQAEFDDLTGIYSRKTFFIKASQLLKNNPDTSFDIIITDIMDFKNLNEVYGISKADEILRWMGSYLAPYMQDNILIGRYGGDQMVLMGPSELYKGEKKLEKLNAFLEALTQNDLPPVIVKFGLYPNIPHNKSIVSSCDKAHIALNSVKNHYDKIFACYDDKLRHELDIKRKIEDSMYASLKNKDFKVYYQPKHDAVTNKLVGAEALIRWNHPTHGFMSPGDFIPLFEKNGFVVEIDSYVWNRTCQNLKRWNQMGLNTVPVSVNTSKLTLQQKNIVEFIQNSVTENQVSPEKLHIEVTETLMYKDNDELINKLKVIKSMGHEIELDDFGTGYSSINILSNLPLDIVKLDMSFIQHLDEEKKKKILLACISLAKDLGYKTISEGVELQSQKDTLAAFGVDIIQGYYYSKPLSESDFEEYLKAHN